MERLTSHPEFRFFADYSPESFTLEEKRLLERFFSNIDRPAFVVSGLPEVVAGALIGRHSQSEHSMRRVFLDEFIQDPEKAREWLEQQRSLGGVERFINLARANTLLESHFVGFGHDSLAAPIPLIIGAERISQLGVKGFEDTRIGLSPIERSTRYGFFGQKVDGRYLYARSPVIMSSPYAKLYEGEIDANIDLYVQLQKPVREAYRRKFPQVNESQIRRMTFDATRVLLVAANFTNVGVMVDGQAAENMLIKLKASPLVEHQELGQILEGEIAKLAPALVARLGADFGRQAINYLVNRRKRVRELADEYLSGIIPEKPPQGPALIHFDPEGEKKVLAKILWPDSSLSQRQVLERIDQLSPEAKMEIIESYIGTRPDRRSKPGRAFEEAVLSFEIICRFGEWRDLQRNRILTPSWRLLDYSLGVEVGEDLREFGFGEVIEERLNKLAEAHATIARDYPVEAQYMVAFGTLMPYLITLNFRELVHLVELRTGPGAHPEYARIASQMAAQAKEVFPLLGKAFQFVNWR